MVFLEGKIIRTRDLRSSMCAGIVVLSVAFIVSKCTFLLVLDGVACVFAFEILPFSSHSFSMTYACAVLVHLFLIMMMMRPMLQMKTGNLMIIIKVLRLKILLPTSIIRLTWTKPPAQGGQNRTQNFSTRYTPFIYSLLRDAQVNWEIIEIWSGRICFNRRACKCNLESSQVIST